MPCLRSASARAMSVLKRSPLILSSLRAPTSISYHLRVAPHSETYFSWKCATALPLYPSPCSAGGTLSPSALAGGMYNGR
jgi:hypothetical protein